MIFDSGKVYEYLGSNRPILALAYKEGEIGELLNATGCGIVSNDVGELKNIILASTQEHKAGKERLSFYQPELEKINRYRRINQAKDLSIIFDGVSAKPKLSN